MTVGRDRGVHPHALLRSLAGGDRRSIGESNRAAALVLEQPGLVSVLFAGLEAGDPVLRMRCADAIEKASARRPDLLAPYKREILLKFSKIEQPDVRWHVAPMLARLPLSAAEEAFAVDLLLSFTQDRSSIVKTLAMQALIDIGLRNRRWLPAVERQVRALAVMGTPAMRSRAKRLLGALASGDGDG
jgi:hypothetical protein